MTAALSPAEVRAILEGLGVTDEWFANHVGVRIRAVQRWKSGVSPINPAATEALLTLEATAAEHVAEHAETFHARPSLPPVLAITDISSDDWPPGWQRMIAFRVRQEVPGLRIVDTASVP